MFPAWVFKQGRNPASPSCAVMDALTASSREKCAVLPIIANEITALLALNPPYQI
jgi:hypothetical protein